MARSILLAVDVEAEPKQVIDAIATEEGEKGFWTANCRLEPKEGTEATFEFPGRAEEPLRVRVDEIGDDRVRWTTLGGFPDWDDTTVTWEAMPSPMGKATAVMFRHEGFADSWTDYEYASVSFVWAQILGRLKGYLETGTPQPFFD